MWCSTAVVQFISVRQISSSRVQRQYVVCACYHLSLCASGFRSIGPRLFTLYTADLLNAVAVHDVNIHSYADDTQLYLRCRSQDRLMAAEQLGLHHSELHWLDVPKRIQYKLGVHRCLQSRAPQYLVAYFACRQLLASSLCQPLSAHCSTTLSQQVWSSGILCCRPDDLKLSA